MTAVLGVLQAAFVFGTELLKFLQTDEGKALLAKATVDRATFDGFCADAAKSVTGFLKGLSI